MIRMYDITQDQEYLDIAKKDEAYMAQYWSTDTCDGGLIWDIRKDVAYLNSMQKTIRS
jgi:hypothetical protein